MPPVTKTGMPANPAPMSVPLTVVAPSVPLANTTGMSRLETLATPGSEARRSRVAASHPTCTAPSITATVAGTDPSSRTMASTAWAVSKLAGYGMPWATIVDSKATTGRPSFKAC